MPSSLFDLISFAGSMNLYELQIRTPIGEKDLAQELGSLMRDGKIIFSSAGDQESEEIISELKTLSLSKFSSDIYYRFMEILMRAIHESRFAESIVVSPTAHGYRFAMS